MKKLLLGLLGLAATMSAMAESREIVSPSGGLKVCVCDDGGKAAYTVSLNGVTCIETSPLGVVLNFADYSSGLKMAQGEAQKIVDVDYSLRNIKRSHVSHKASEMVIPFTKDGKPVFDLVMHVADNDVAFKYRIHAQGNTQLAVHIRINIYGNSAIQNQRINYTFMHIAGQNNLFPGLSGGKHHALHGGSSSSHHEKGMCRTKGLCRQLLRIPNNRYRMAQIIQGLHGVYVQVYTFFSKKLPQLGIAAATLVTRHIKGYHALFTKGLQGLVNRRC